MMRRLLTAAALWLACSAAQASLAYAITAAPEARIKAAGASKEKLSELLLRGQDDHVQLDKLWHGLEWLLGRHCGATACQIIMGGRKVGPDLGYGPAFYYTAEEVKRIARQLAAIDPAQLAAHFDATAMDKASIYPSDWVERERSGTAPARLLQDAFVRLRDFFQRSADAGHAVAYVLY
ncbi:YfbM family protein [Pseudoduganella sp.]|uniref:YfbM family protein n=1 Tax=Pseudoduganella sp. TaxID=1880898 RepID=UPI0035B4E1EF